PESASEPAAGDAGNSASSPSAPSPGAMATRDQIYRTISQAADALQRIEPHSPIPDLLRRAVELGQMPFRRLIKELVQDGNSLAQVYREFGIRDDGSGS